MTDQELKDQWREHALNAFLKVPGNRAYATDDAATTSLTAAVAALVEHRNENGEKFDFAKLVEFFTALAPLQPGMLQERPSSPPPTPSEWLDPVTKQPARNPFSDPPDIDSQGAVMKNDPVLAEHLKAIAGGVTYKFLAKKRDEEAKRQQAASIRYTDAEHHANPFRFPDQRAAQARFIREHPELEATYRREASAFRPAWSPNSKNWTLISKITDRDPVMGKIIARASAIEEAWTEQEITAKRAAVETATAQLKAAEAQLQAK
jgi:hypothetical protein